MRRLTVFVSLVAMALTLLLLGAGDARGTQSLGILDGQETQSTQVLIVPASSVVAAGETAIVEIQVRDVVNLYGLDLTVSFDPNVLWVEDAHPARTGVQIEPGDFLDLLWLYPARNEAVNETGAITYTVTLIPPGEPASGSGVLARITFRALRPGTSGITFTRGVLANHCAEPIVATWIGDSITVSGPTASPSPTSATATPTSTPTHVPSPTATHKDIEQMVLEDAARTLGWPSEVVVHYPLYTMQYAAAAGHFAEAWIQRFGQAAEAYATLIQQRDALVAGGWDVDALLFHGFDAYEASHSLNPGSPTLPMNERTLVFQGSVWIVGAYAFDDTPYSIAPDPRTVAEAVYQAGLSYGLFEELVSRAFLPIVLRGYPTPMPSPSPTVTPSPTPSPSPSPTVTATALPSPSPSPTLTGSATPSPSPSLTPGVSETPTTGPSPTPTATATSTPQYTQLILNHSFEREEAWEILRTTYPAGYSVGRAHSGSRSMRLGIDTGYNVESYSSVQQTVDIPSGVTQAELSFYYFPVSAQVDGDLIYFCVLPTSGGGESDCTYWTDHNQAWNLRTFDLLGYAGQRVNLRFGVKNDGHDGITAVYLDDVELRVVSSE